MADADSVEQRLRAVGYKRRLRWRSAFVDHDRLRTGKVAAATFHRCVNSLLGSPGLDERDLAGLVARYGVGDGRVDWVAFAAAVDAEGAPLEKTPMAIVSTLAARPTSPRSQILAGHVYCGKTEDLPTQATLDPRTRDTGTYHGNVLLLVA